MSVNFEAYFLALPVILAIGFVAWTVSVAIRNVSFVDSLWSLFFLVAASVFAMSTDVLSLRGQIVFVLVAVWAIRLSVYITARNWGEEEDRRYRKIRARNEPFWIKSLYIVFGAQGVLAWIIALPLVFAIMSGNALGIPDYLALVLWVTGFSFEAIGDYQLARFRRDPASSARVMNTGLWRYTRHPNYFGDFCVWWSFYLFAFAGGGWWTIVSPLLMSVLLLKVSGVALLERTIRDRRPAYAEYVIQTNAFFPGPPKKPAQPEASR